MKFKGEGVTFDEATETVTFELKKPLSLKRGEVTSITLRTDYAAGDLVAIGRGEKDNSVDGLLHLAAELSQINADQPGHSYNAIRRLKKQDTNTLLAVLGEILKEDAPDADAENEKPGDEKKLGLGMK